MIDTSKIIHAPVGGGRYTVTAPIVKEDYGLQLQIEGVDLPSSYQVDFSNSEHGGTSTTMISTSNRVRIPTEFIKSGKDIFAFLYIVGSNYGRTVYKFRIPNKLRPDRTNEQPTPEQQSVIDQAIAALNDAVEQTAQDVEDADENAQSASESAEQAQESARTAGLYSDTAQTYANSAEISANSASASATASAQSASQSAQIKTDVEDLVDDAQGYAQASAQSATASANSASQASESATSASQSASTASQKATEASQSAENAQTYTTQARQAKAGAETAQTFAENARDDAETARDEAVTAKENAEQAKADAESARDEAQQAVASISGALDDKAPVITDTASGAIASFTDGADDLPLKSLVIDINPVQDLSHGDPSPENICPISGWTQVQTTRNGSNLWNPVPNGMAKWNPSIGEQIPALTTNFTTFENDVLAVNTNWAWNGNAFITNKLLTGRTYRVTGVVNSNSNRARIGVYTLDANRRVVRIVRYVADNGNMDVSVTMGASDVYICVSAANATDNEAVTITNPCISESGVYEPYTGRSITIDLGQTVYGGHLDVLSGILTAYPYYASYNGETLTGEWISDRDVYAVGTTPTIGAQVVDMSGTGAEVQLEAHEVKSLLGANNLFADTGDTEVEYRADTKLYINRLTEPDADMIADANIVSGQYFMVGNSLFKATANIASGSAVIVGTNATRKSLSEALNEINA